MTRTFECPSCGAPLRHLGTPKQFCTYCESTIVVPTAQQPRRRAWPVRKAVNFPRVAVSRVDIAQRNKRFLIFLGLFVLVVLLVAASPFILIIVLAILRALTLS